MRTFTHLGIVGPVEFLQEDNDDLPNGGKGGWRLTLLAHVCGDKVEVEDKEGRLMTGQRSTDWENHRFTLTFGADGTLESCTFLD